MKNKQVKNMPVAKAVTNIQRNPQIKSTINSTIVTHRELIDNIFSSTFFYVDQLKVNPGLSTNFPWLSKIAGAYEKYRFRKLKFEYIPSCATTQNGSFGMYFDYDPTDGKPGNVVEFSNMAKAQLTQIWSGATLVVQPQTQYLFTRNSNLGDLKLFDYGSINYYMNCPEQVTGLLFMEYELELVKPHNHLEETIFVSDEAYARWNTASTSTQPTNTPQNTAKLTWGNGADQGKFKISSGDEGLYEVAATVATPSGQNIVQVVGSNRTGVVATIANMLTEARVIVNLIADTWYIPFVISGGVVGPNSLMTLKRLQS